MIYLICDIDGTVADLSHRLHYVRTEGQKKDWKSFLDPDIVAIDKPIRKTINVVTGLANYYNLKVIFVSGRTDKLANTTKKWLGENFGYGFNCILKMRKDGDYRADDIIKDEIRQELNDQYGVTPNTTLAVFDDRDRVVAMWRRNGFQVYQVDYGNF